ncbi:unnamed protein product [Prunus armeniaca]|uniref:RPW8 domain-containing protein n=1 Tax=Prunus armeniaca TaxID=36596 RepID=A0A6J5VH75_PRUAR|nr:unnamed protein product [Prunus armeniaca]
MAGVETILGAAISELVVLLKKTIQKLKDCPALFKNLDATLVSLHPLIQEMENLNRYLGRPKEEIESLKTRVDAGYKVRSRNLQVEEGQTARNGMETLLCTRMIFGLVVVIALVALLLLWSNGLIRLHTKESPGLKITEKSLVNMDKASTIRVNHAE